MVIGGAPSHDDNRTGNVFSGKDGRLLDEMLADAGADNVYMTKVLKCLPERGKFPVSSAATCQPYALEQIKLVKPRAVLLVGREAVQSILLHGTGQILESFTEWVGNQYRRRDLFGETRFGVAWTPKELRQNKNPDDNEACVAMIFSLLVYAQAKIEGRPPPLVAYKDIALPPPTMNQSRALFRTGQRYPSL